MRLRVLAEQSKKEVDPARKGQESRVDQSRGGGLLLVKARIVDLCLLSCKAEGGGKTSRSAILPTDGCTLPLSRGSRD